MNEGSDQGPHDTPKNDQHIGHQLTDQLARTLRVDTHERTLRGPVTKVGQRRGRFGSPQVLLAPARRQDSPVRFRAVTIVLTTGLLLLGCTRGGSGPTPSPVEDSAARAAAHLAAGLAKKDVSAVEFAGLDSAVVNDELKPWWPAWDRWLQTSRSDGCTSRARWPRPHSTINWTFPGISAPWTYETSARLVDEAGRWKSSWLPSVVQPDLDGSNRLSQHRLHPERGEVRGDGGIPIVSLRAVVRFGIDKGRSERRAGQDLRRPSR